MHAPSSVPSAQVSCTAGRLDARARLPCLDDQGVDVLHAPLAEGQDALASQDPNDCSLTAPSTTIAISMLPHTPRRSGWPESYDALGGERFETAQ